VAAGAALKRHLALVLLLLFAGCSGHKLDLEALSSASDQVVWEAGQKAAAKHDWESARQYYKRIIDAFPQSEYQPRARLALGDSYFEEGGTANYVLAVSSYREFLTLYPSDQRSDYAQLRVADSYFKQKNSADRDQTSTKHALEEYERLLDVYPQSSYVEQTRERVKACRQTLAQADFDVGYFYQRTRKSWRAAILRYQDVLAEYPDFDRSDEVLFRLSECLGAAGRYPEARPYIARLIADYPQSPFVDDARKLEATFPPPGVPAPEPTAPAKPAGPPPEKPATGPDGAKPPGAP